MSLRYFCKITGSESWLCVVGKELLRVFDKCSYPDYGEEPKNGLQNFLSKPLIYLVGRGRFKLATNGLKVIMSLEN